MERAIFAASIVGLCGTLGCANSWDRMTSQDFKKKPFHAMFTSEDPMHVLRSNPEGGARAKAMGKVKEPLQHGGTQAEQDELVEQILGPAATSDPSPVVRAAAIDALGRFHDPRVPNILVAAYHNATGRPNDPKEPPAPASPIQQTAGGAKKPMPSPPKFGLFGPTGFPSDTTAMLRSKALMSLGATEQPESVQFLLQVATTTSGNDTADREARLAAVRVLGQMKEPSAVPALAKVLEAEASGDTALANRAHEGLVAITGKDLPADPEEWNQVIQATYQPAPTNPPGK